MSSRSDLLFDAEMSVKYHRRRATFLERSGQIMSVAILVGGATAFAGMFGSGDVAAKIGGAIIAALGIIQIVFQPDRCAAEHRNWLRAWGALLTDIKQSVSSSPEEVAAWEARKIVIEGECVGEMRALQEDCYNRTMAALNWPGTPTRITFLQRRLMQVLSFENSFQGKGAAKE